MLMTTLELEIEDLSVLPALQEVLSRFKGVALKSSQQKSFEELRKSNKKSDQEEYLKRVKSIDEETCWKEFEILTNEMPECSFSEEEIVAEIKKCRSKK